MYKVGDKIICKKNYKYKSYYDEEMKFLKDCEYKILNIDTTYGFYTRFKVEYNSERYCDFIGDYLIYEHFYTTQELRKKKLNKLGCTSLIITEE